MKREWLIRYRKKKELTQEQVASMVFIDRGYYSHIETGKRNPSFSIAVNIAKVLNFEPSLFFQEDSVNKPNESNNVEEALQRVEHGNILYLYDDLDFPLDHLITFILKGIDQGSYCYIVGDENELTTAENKLQTVIDNQTSDKYINYMEKSEKDIHLFNNELLDMRGAPARLQIWFFADRKESPEKVMKDVGRLLNLNDRMKNKKFLSIYSINAGSISAGTHIKLMKQFKYLMTDFEIVNSPFYQFDDHSVILPSFYKQNNLKNNQ